MNAHTLIFIAELIGVAAFAISGVLVAIDRNLDLFGALVLGAITAVGGGMLRDMMIGHHPPAVFINPIYALIAVIVSLAVFLLAYFLGDRIDLHSERLARIVNFFDALGLGIFAIVGVDAVLGGEMRENGFLAVFIGTITAVGGGLLRDIFVASVPSIFRKHVYAVAAILGSALYYFSVSFGLPVVIALPLTVAVIVTIRLLAAHYRWNMPHVPLSDRTEKK